MNAGSAGQPSSGSGGSPYTPLSELNRGPEGGIDQAVGAV